MNVIIIVVIDIIIDDSSVVTHHSLHVHASVFFSIASICSHKFAITHTTITMFKHFYAITGGEYLLGPGFTTEKSEVNKPLTVFIAFVL